MASDLVLHDPSVYDRGFPYEHFRRLRAEAPVTHHDHEVWPNGYYAVVRHADVVRVSRDSSTFKNAPHPMIDVPAEPEAEAGLAEMLISKDPPEHTKMRKLISFGFTPKRVADLTDKIRERVDGLIDGLRDRNDCDLVTDLALWLPLHVIADLVGVPEADRAHIFDLTELTFGFDPNVDQEARGAAAIEMYTYADTMCEDRRKHPRDDLMSVLLEADVDGEQLTQMQLDLFFLMLQNAGSETTRNLITTGTLALLQHPDQLERLRSDSDRLPLAIEELLRFSTPVMQFFRHATTDTEVAGRPIKAGDHVLIVYASANRDETVFADPDGLDIAREPNPHVAFGAGGPHFCLGANLARIEARVMFDAILHRFEGLEINGSPDDFPRVHSNLIDGFAHLPIGWTDIRARSAV